MIPASFILIESHQTSIVSRIIVTEEDRADMRDLWDRPNMLISRLNHMPWLLGATAWAHLSRAQIQTLIALHITIYNEQRVPDPVIKKGLHQALVALVINLEQQTGTVPMMRVRHFGSLHLEVDVSLTIGVRLEQFEEKLTPKMRVVVNNDAERH